MGLIVTRTLEGVSVLLIVVLVLLLGPVQY
jgi:hypothetical protein